MKKTPLQQDVELKVADSTKKSGVSEFLLRFDYEAIARAEDISGQALLTGLTQRMADHPTISFVRAMLFAALLHHEPGITYAEAAALVTRKSLADIWGKLILAWVASMQEETEEPADPTTAQS